MAKDECWQAVASSCRDACWVLLQVVDKQLERTPDEADAQAVRRWLSRLSLNLAIDAGDDQPSDWLRCGLVAPPADLQ